MPRKSKLIVKIPIRDFEGKPATASKAMGQCVSCLDEDQKQQRKEEERLASVEARSKAAEAAQRR